MEISFRNRILLSIGLSCCVCTGAAVLISSTRLQAEGRRDLIDKSRAILSRIEVGAQYVAQMKTLDGVISDAVADHPDGKIPDDTKLKILKSVPVYAAFQIGLIGAEKEHYKFRIASDAPRQPDNRATPEEVAVIEKFRKDPQLTEHVEESADGKFMLVSRPVRIMEERGCLTCHGNPANSPWGNGKDILGYTMENMKDGEMRATFTIISSLEPVKAAAQASTASILGWGALIAIFTVGLGYLVIRKPIGDLTQLADGLSESADDVAGMSSQIASTSSELSSGATEQAAALEETSASMEEMSAMVTRNFESAKQSQDVSAQSQQAATRGQSVVAEMLQSIEDIDQSNSEIMKQIDESNQQISEIVKVINDIGNKTKVINEIVFQTKLLSFNASVEAARAGEHGKGFAVVAEEVGNLAAMSGSAAAEITEILGTSIQTVEEIIRGTKSKVEALVKTGKTKVETGTRVARQCSDVLNEIVASVQSVDSMVVQIAESSQEQAKGVQEINKAMLQLNSVTQQNTNASQASSLAAEKLSSQASVLRETVQSVLKTLSGQASGGDLGGDFSGDFSNEFGNADNNSRRHASAAQSKGRAKKRKAGNSRGAA